MRAEPADWRVDPAARIGETRCMSIASAVPDLPAPFHAFEGVHNFRDFGGYAARGGRIATGVLYRSGSHAQASAADLARMAELGIATVVDLRRPEERTRNLSRRWEGFACQVIENHDDAEGHQGWDAFMATWDMSAEAFRAFQLRYYDEAPFMPRLLDLGTRWFDALAHGESAFLLHCAAGKDRTGLIAALTHYALGVSWDDIVADYMLTNASGRFERAAEAYVDVIERRFGKRPPMEAMKVAMSVEPEYIARSFEAIRERAGDVDAYLQAQMGLDAGKRERIAARLVR
jgi:protein-tyrosine phosphatase